MQKRGQITLFIILGLIIIISISLGIYFSNIISKSAEEAILIEREALSQKEKNIAYLIEDCIYFTVEKGLFEISKNGGYYPPKKDSIPYMIFNIPLYYKNGKENVPNNKIFEQSLANYINDNLNICLNELNGFKVIKKPKTKISINNDNIIAEVEMLVMIENTRLSKFITKYDLKSKKLFYSINEFYNIVKEYDEEIDLIKIAKTANEKKYKYSISSLKNATIYYLIFDNFSEKKSLIFTFGIQKKELEEFYSQNDMEIAFDSLLDALISQQEEEEEEEELNLLTPEEYITETQFNESQADDMGGDLLEI